MGAFYNSKLACLKVLSLFFCPFVPFFEIVPWGTLLSLRVPPGSYSVPSAQQIYIIAGR